MADAPTRRCAACGHENALAKRFCDACGRPLDPPPPAAPGIPATAIRRLDTPPQQPGLSLPPAAGLPPGLPPAPGSPLPPPGAQSPEFAAGAQAGWGQPATPTPAPAAPRSSPVKLALNAALFAAGLVALGVGAARWQATRTPERMAQRAAARYLDALRRRDLQAAYDQFSTEARSNCTFDEFRASRDATPWTWSGLKLERLEPGAALFSYTLKVDGAEPRTDRVLFVEEPGRGWVRPYNWTLMRKVEEAFDRGDPAMGLALAQAAAQVDPRDPMARGYLCEAAYYRQSPDEAARQCESALRLAALYPSNLSLKSLYHLNAIMADTEKNALGRPEKALEPFGRMLAFPNISAADQCDILLARAEAYEALKRSAEGLADLDKAAGLCRRPQDQDDIRAMRQRLGAGAEE